MDFKTGRGKLPIPPIYRRNWQRREDVCVTLTGNEKPSVQSSDINLSILVTTGDTTSNFTITAASESNITSVNNGGLTTFVININASLNVLPPFSLNAGDVVNITYDPAVSDTIIELIGTY
jgi:hypothetical protein